MLRGMYGAAAGMIAQQQRQEMLTNNLANVQTAGFKADQATIRSFPNMMLKAMRMREERRVSERSVRKLGRGVRWCERVEERGSLSNS